MGASASRSASGFKNASSHNPNTCAMLANGHPLCLINPMPADPLACPCTDAVARARAGVTSRCETCGSSVDAPASSGRQLGDAKRDLQLVARHLATIVGRSAALEPHRGGASDGPDRSGLRDAIRVLGRLVAVEWRLRLALVYAYLVTGPEVRERTAGFPARVGLVFASETKRKDWLLNPRKAMGRGLAATEGETLLRDATLAYARVGEVVTANDGRWIAKAIDEVTRMDAVATAEGRDLHKTREQNRCAPPGSPKNRKERRALLLRTPRAPRA